MTDLRAAAQQALEALEGWANHGKWVWPESALETCKRNTVEALDSLRAALAQQEQPKPVELTIERLRDALVASRVIDAAAIDDPEGYDDGVMLDQVRAAYRRLV